MCGLSGGRGQKGKGIMICWCWSPSSSLSHSLTTARQQTHSFLHQHTNTNPHTHHHIGHHASPMFPPAAPPQPPQEQPPAPGAEDHQPQPPPLPPHGMPPFPLFNFNNAAAAAVGAGDQQPLRPAHAIISDPAGGTSMLQVYLEPFEVIRAPPQHFLYASSNVSLVSYPREGQGFFSSLLGASITDDSFRNVREGELGCVAFSAGHPGEILALNLNRTGPLLVQNDCYLAYSGQVTHKRTVLQAGEGTEQIVMQRLSTPGPWPNPGPYPGHATVFIQSQGALMKTELRSGESMNVKTECITAITEGVTLGLPLGPRRGGDPGVGAGRHEGGVGGAAAGFPRGEWYERYRLAEWFHKRRSVCVVRGPGTVYISSLPASKLAHRVLTSASRADAALPMVRLLRMSLFFTLLIFTIALLHHHNMIAFDGPEF